MTPRVEDATASSLDSEGHMAEPERPIGVIINDLWEKAEVLVRQEMRLGLTEAEERVGKLRRELGEQAIELKAELTAKLVGGAVLFAALLVLLAALTLLLAEAVAPWLAALIVSAVVGVGGVLLLQRDWRPPHHSDNTGRNNSKTDARTIQEATHDSAL
jgi:hypothetical protein